MAFNKKKVLSDNLTALDTTLKLLSERIFPNEREVSILNNYKGFGGVKEILLDTTDPSSWKKSDLPLLEDVRRVQDICAQFDEFLKVPSGTSFNSAKQSILSAFFTPDDVVSSITDNILNEFNKDDDGLFKSYHLKDDIASELNLGQPNILEPSSGNGFFVNAIRNHPSLFNTKITSVEKDILSGCVQKVIMSRDNVNNNSVNVIINGFENLSLTNGNGGYDLIISNIPFGDIKVFDKFYLSKRELSNYFSNSVDRSIRSHSTDRIHNYFFIKALDRAKNGGIIAFITTNAFLDSPTNQPYRSYLIENADVVSVIRLPNNTFKDFAGTEALSDLIILKKNIHKKSLNIGLSDLEQKFITSEAREGFGYVNSLFNFYNLNTKNPNFIADTITMDTNQYGKPSAVLYHPQIGDVLNQYLKRDFALFNNKNREFQQQPIKNTPTPKVSTTIQLDLFASVVDNNDKIQAEVTTNNSTSQLVLGSAELPFFYFNKSNVLHLHNGTLGILSENEDKQFTFSKVPILSLKDHSKMVAYTKVRNAYLNLYHTEENSATEHPQLREVLNNEYHLFIAKYGSLNLSNNRSAILKDVFANEIFGIEKKVNALKNSIFTKSDIFFKPVFRKALGKEILSPKDALFLCLNQKAKVDVDYLIELTGLSKNILLQELKEDVFANHINKSYETLDSLLQGNIRQKINAYEIAFPKNNLDDLTSYEGRTYQALVKHLPERVSYHELDLTLGERWIPNKYFEQYAQSVFQSEISIHYVKSTDEYKCDTSSNRRNNSIISEVYATKSSSRIYDGLNLLSYALVNTTPHITKKVYENGKEYTVEDDVATKDASQKINKLREGFSAFMQNLPNEDTALLEELYNNTFNCFANYESSFAQSLTVDIQGKNLYPHQKDAIWHILNKGGGICDHPVGAGKTLVMCATAQKLRETGLAKKPMIIAMLANAEQIAQAYKEAFPDAKVLYPTKQDTQRRNRIHLLNSIKNNDWDCVILTHDQFSAIPQSEGITIGLLDREIKQLDEDLEQIKYSGGEVSKQMLKGLEKRKISLEYKLNNILNNIKKDDIVSFDKLGIDHLMVDESQQFKNLGFTTRHNRVAGLGNQEGSNRAFNLEIACRSIQQQNGGDKGITFFSGTTISNSLTEMYNLFKYLAPNALEAQNIYNFDSWANVFAIKTSEYEVSVTNDIIIKERFRKFIKVPELAAFYRQITHFISQKELNIERPKMVSKLVNIPQTAEQQIFTEKIKKFVEFGDPSIIGRQGNGKSKNEQAAKMLIATNTAKKMAMDMRLVDPLASDSTGSKLSNCATILAEKYNQYEHCKGTQLVFCDTGTPGTSGFNIYEDLKRKLVEEYKIPADEIKFIHDAKSDRARENLFDKVNNGDVRILLGSTQKLGTGVNCQNRIVAMHHLDIPWTPKDLEQRNGRGIRQGNLIAKEFCDNKVEVFTYAVEQTLDAYQFNLLTNKQLFIDQIKNNSINVRSIDEGAIDESNGMPYAEFLAVISGNTDLIDKVRLQKKLALLNSSIKSYQDTEIKNQSSLLNSEKSLERKINLRDRLNADLGLYLSHKPITNTNDSEKVVNTINTIKIGNIDLSTHPQPHKVKAEVIGKEILKYSNDKSISKPTKIGELLGFDLMVKRTSVGNVLYAISPSNGSIEYNFSNGAPNENPSYAARYFHNALEKLPKLAAEQVKAVKDTIENIEGLKKVSQNFMQDNICEKLLKEKNTLTQELDSIEERLQNSTKKNKQIGEGGEQNKNTNTNTTKKNNQKL